MKIRVKFKSLLKVLVILVIFLMEGNVKALEETPEYCFGHRNYMAGPIEVCDDFICEPTENGETLCSPDCYWSEMSQSIEIFEYKCYEGNEYGFETITDVVIPTNLYKYDEPIPSNIKFVYNISIDNDTFANKNITSIVIPNTVTSIRENAFYNNNIEDITIPNNVVKIEKLAFANNNITKVINKSNIDNSILKDNIGRSDQNYLIFGTDCNRSEDGITTCLGEKNINISNTEIVDDDNNNPSNDDKYEEIEKNPNDEQDSSLENNDNNNIIDNPKTLDSNVQIFILVVIFSLIVIILMLLKMKKI